MSEDNAAAAEPEINPSPENVGDLTDAQIDEALEGVVMDDNGEGEPLEFGEVEVVEDDPDADDDDEKDSGDDSDDAPEGESDDEDDTDKDAQAGDGDQSDDDDSEAGDDQSDDDADAIPPAQRAAMESVLNRLEIMEAEREQLNAKLEQAEILRDRNAGKLGSLMQKLEKRDAKGADDSYNDNDSADDDDSTQSKDKSAGEEALAEIRQEKVARSVNTAAQDFYRANTEFFSELEKEAGAEKAEAFQADLVARVTAANAEVGEEILAMSPKMAGKMAAAVIKTCFADMRVDLLRDFKTEASGKADKSRKAIRARKKGAAGIRSNKRPGTSTTKTKSLSKTSDKDLDAMLAQAAAAGSFD